MTIIAAGSGTRAEDRHHTGFATAQQTAGTRQVRLYHYGCSVIVGFDGLSHARGVLRVAASRTGKHNLLYIATGLFRKLRHGSVDGGVIGIAGVDAGTREMPHIAVLLIQKDAVALSGSAVEK